MNVLKILPVICFCLLFNFGSANAQFSIDVGYTGSTIINNPLSKIIRSYNSYLADGAKSMKRMHYLNGLHVAFGSINNPVNWSVEYNGTFSSLSAKKLLNASHAEYNYILNFSVHACGPSLSFALGDPVNLGVTALYNWYSIKDYRTDNSQRSHLASGKSVSFKPFVEIDFGADVDRITSTLRFFANIPMKPLDVQQVYSVMDPEGKSDLKNPPVYKLTSVGVSIILHNKW